MAAVSDDSALRTSLLVRRRGGTALWWGPTADGLEPEERMSVPAVAASEFSPDGSVMAVVAAAEIIVIDVATGEEKIRLERSGVGYVSLSEKGTYLVSYEKHTRAVAEEGGNLIVWNVETGEILARWTQRKLDKDSWPSVRWHETEEIAAHKLSDAVVIRRAADMEEVARIPFEGVARMKLAPGALPGYIALASMSSGAKPGRCALALLSTGRIVASKTYSKCEKLDMQWSPLATALVVRTGTAMSRDSYYGDHRAYLLTVRGDVYTVVSTKEGPIHDVKWDPNGETFLTLNGRQPTNITLYDLEATPIHQYDGGHRSVIVWSPHGRFFAVAGFNGMAGEIDFYDRNKRKIMGSTVDADAIQFGFSPCSRYFMTATVTPRLRMDNGFRIYKYNGEGPIFSHSGDEIYQVSWRPAAKGVYPDRPQTPKKRRPGEEPAAKPKPKKRQAYRPPHATGKLSAMLSSSREKESRSRSLHAYRPPSAERRIPGMAPPTAGKKKKKRKKKGAASAEDEAAEKAFMDRVSGGGGGGSGGAADATSLAKKVKKMKKKLRQIAALKDRVAAGESLDEEQTTKLAKAAEYEAELAAAESALAALS